MVPIPPDLDLGIDLRPSIEKPRKNQEWTNSDSPSYQKNQHVPSQSLNEHGSSSLPKYDYSRNKFVERGMSPLRQTNSTCRYTLKENVGKSKQLNSFKTNQHRPITSGGEKNTSRGYTWNKIDSANASDKVHKQFQRKLAPLRSSSSSSRQILNENNRWRKD